MKRKYKKNESFGSKGNRWAWYSYDVWGNKKDGYEVNQVFRSSDYAYIPDSIVTDKALIAYLKREGFLRLSARAASFDLDGDEDVIYFSYNGKPEGELRRER